MQDDKPDIKLYKSLLYATITRYGKIWGLDYFHDPSKFLKDIEVFDNDWKQYNPRKSIPRQGLSITSLDGGLSGVPDLDSFKEYNAEKSTQFTEVDITTPTPVYEYARPYLAPFEGHICRTHVIRLAPGGYFPPHRDSHFVSIKSFRIFVPLKACNPEHMYFLQEDRILHFEHGRPYFIDTCVRHSLFNYGPDHSYFIVVNVELTRDSVDALLSRMV